MPETCQALVLFRKMFGKEWTEVPTVLVRAARPVTIFLVSGIETMVLLRKFGGTLFCGSSFYDFRLKFF